MDCNPDALMAAAKCFRCIPKGMSNEVRTYLMCQWANRPSGPAVCTSAVVDSWVTRVQANGGGVPAQSTVDALCIFMTGMDSAGLTGKMYVVNVFAPTPAGGDTTLLATARTPLIKNTGIDPWTNVNFVGADYTINGLKGDAVNKALLTGMIPVNFLTAVNSNGMTVYITDNPVAGGIEALSHANDATGTFGIYNSDGAGNILFESLNFTTGRLTVASQGAGFYCGTRRAAGANEFLYYAKSTTPVTQVAGPGGASGNVASPAQLNVFCRSDSAGTRSFFSHDRLSFYAVHSGLTLADVQAFFTLVQDLRVRFGGGFV